MKALPAIAAAFALSIPAAHAQTYPTKPIRIVVPFSAGGSTDTMARAIGQQLAAGLKQPVVIDNKTGAGGVIGSQEVARSAADGYTLLLATSSTHGVNPWLYPKLPYDVNKDFSAVSILATTDYALGVGASVPANNLAELLKLGKSGNVTYGSSGNGTTGHLSGALLAAYSKTPLLHIPYKGGAQALSDVIANQITFVVDNTSSLTQQAAAGKIKILATTGPQRSRITPNVPTMVEAGMPDFKVIGWWALLAPANTPKPILDLLNQQVVKATHSAELRPRMSDVGNEPTNFSASESDAFIKSELVKFKKFVAVSGVKVE